MTSDPLQRAPGELPPTVSRLELEGREIYLVATAHVSKRSVEDVRATIEAVAPDTVCVELDAARHANLTNREAWRKLDIFKVLKEGKAALLLSSLLMSSFQKRIAEELGVTPGAEMLEAVRLAEERGAELVLADRDIQVTLKRAWANLSLWSKLKVVPQLVAGLVLPHGVDEETVEALKDEEKLGDLMQLVAAELPEAKETLIDERDVYLAQAIRKAPGQRLVAVVGAGHVPGIRREILHDAPVDALNELPRPSLLPKVLKWAIPLAIVAIVAYGFTKGGLEHSMGSVYLWVGINGVLSALGAALAFGHPLTVLSAFVAAPLTSLNPMVAAGWVAGLVQAWVKSPTVEDLENLPEAIVTVKGFWRNSVCRVLLVVMLANLGSTAGTFIAGSWIAARTF